MPKHGLRKYRPIKVGNLARFGKNSDGGYCLPRNLATRTETLLSFGICDDWSFEQDFLRENNARLYAFDFSVSRKIYLLRLCRHLWEMRLRRVRQIDLPALKNFGAFFDGKQRIFVKKFLGDTDSEQFITVDAVFKKLGSVPDLSIFVKMDIEEWEYRTLPMLVPYGKQINGMAIEFHGLDVYWQQFTEIMDLLMGDFYIAHMHANAVGGLIPGTDVPRTLEISLINRTLLSGQNIEPSPLVYPVPGLDFSCDKRRSDMPLNFD